MIITYKKVIFSNYTFFNDFSLIIKNHLLFNPSITMHEKNLVKNIFDTLIENFNSKINDIIEVELTAGILSNVDPILTKDAFSEFVKKNSNYKNIKLDIKLIDIEALCKKCNRIFTAHNRNIVCEVCVTPSITIVKGKELYISKVIFENSPL